MSKQESVWCEPYDADTHSTPRAVAKRLSAVLTALDSVDSRAVKGTLPNELWEFRMSLHERLKSEGWRITAEQNSWKVLPPLKPRGR